MAKVNSALAATFPSTVATASPTPIGAFTFMILVLQHQYITRMYLLLFETAFINAYEICCFAFPFRLSQIATAPTWASASNDKHSGHYRIPRKMSGKIRFIKADAFPAQCTLPGSSSSIVINQHERMSVWNDLHDFLCCIN